ncbi:MAG: flagellar biosynthetic protein FliO [Pirellulaceae bacterium]
MRIIRIWALLLLLAPASTAAAQGGEPFYGAVDDSSSYPVAPASAEGYPPPATAAGDAPRGAAELMPFRRAEQASFEQEIGASGAAPLKIDPPSDRRRLERPDAPTPGSALATVLGSLGVVLGLFFAVVWFTRRALPKAATTLPAEAVEVLGRTPLSARQNMHVIRFGGKLLLISASQSGAQTLAEIDNVEEVTRITGICKQNQPGSISSTFRQVLSQFASEPAPGGFLGADEDSAPTAASRSTRSRRSVASRDA